MARHRRLTVLLAVAICTAAMVAGARGAAAERPADTVAIWRVYVDTRADVDRLLSGGYDLVEGRGDDYLLVVGEDAVAQALRGDGFRVVEDRQLDKLAGVVRGTDELGRTTAAAATYYGGYRTVDEHYLHLANVAATYPSLATTVDYGDSWRKVQGLATGNDLMAICLTHRQPGDCSLSPSSPKPRAMVMAAIHARELQTSELAWRLIDALTQGYGSDPEITLIMDTTEVWIIPVVNPDGREIVEGGGNSPYLQRKNANDSLGNCSVPPTGSNHHGVDLNRNASYQWGGVGTTADPCAQTYKGVSPASEPEQSALQNLFGQLWPDQHTTPTDPVATTATGTFITLHSYGNLVLLPPGAGGTAPNDAQLRALAFRMSHFNGYVAGTGPEVLYGTTGTTDDWIYAQLGVAGFTFEVSPTSGSCSGFTPAYSCVDSTLWPLNRPALLYSLKVAGAPYVTPRGPTTTSVTAPTSVAIDSSFVLSAVLDDNAFGTASGSVGRPAAQVVDAAQYYLDVPPTSGGTAVAMAPSDGAFSATSEGVRATVPTAGLSLGTHRVYVRGRNAAGFWGPISAASFAVALSAPDNTAPSAPSALKKLVAGTSQAVLDWPSSTDNVGVTGYRIFRNGVLLTTVPTTYYLDSGLQAGTSYGYEVRAVDAAGNQSAASPALTARTSALGTATTGALSGAVFGPTGSPLGNASASLTLGTGSVKTAKTNASGVWKISNLRPAAYQVTVSLTGYGPKTFTMSAAAGRTLLGVTELAP